MSRGELSAEQRAEWRKDAERRRDGRGNTPQNQRIRALLDALDAAEARVAVVESDHAKTEHMLRLVTEDARRQIARAEAAGAEVSNLSADYDRRGERLWRLAAKAGHVPADSDNDASAELTVSSRLEALAALVEAGLALADELQKPANECGGHQDDDWCSGYRQAPREFIHRIRARAEALGATEGAGEGES